MNEERHDIKVSFEAIKDKKTIKEIIQLSEDYGLNENDNEIH